MNTNKTEERKNQLDLRPALEFVDRHVECYENATMQMFRSEASNLSVEFCRRLKYQNTKEFDGRYPQMSPRDIPLILSSLPSVFLKLSLLAKVDYVHNLLVPVPVFEVDGTWKNADLVPVETFPRQGDHPSRILIGSSTGVTIFPTALPASVLDSVRVRWFYQMHVFLHEFFHTIEYLRMMSERQDGVRSLYLTQVVLSTGTSKFTLQDWWNLWANLFINGEKQRFVTRYAASYADSLNAETLEKHPAQFNRALAEQVCESFAGYILGTAPNDEDESDFREHSPMAWGLMDNLARARMVS
jgi:hypothetical protein